MRAKANHRFAKIKVKNSEVVAKETEDLEKSIAQDLTKKDKPLDLSKSVKIEVNTPKVKTPKVKDDSKDATKDATKDDSKE